MAKAKYKIQFTKFRDGQSFFERSVDLQTLEILLIVCQSVRVVLKEKKKKGRIIFTLNAGKFNTYASAEEIPIWVLRKFLPASEWVDKNL